jgi:hypothetical protein
MGRALRKRALGGRPYSLHVHFSQKINEQDVQNITSPSI